MELFDEGAEVTSPFYLCPEVFRRLPSAARLFQKAVAFLPTYLPGLKSDAPSPVKY